MSKIKNKDELVNRSVVHREQDRFIATSYVSERGGTEFKGCLIGCLAMPTSSSGLLDALKSLGKAEGRMPWMLRRLKSRFGIDPALARVAEMFLMSYEDSSGDRLGGFTQSFCEALPEGVDIDRKLVTRWMESRKAEYAIDTHSSWGGLHITGDISVAMMGGSDYTTERKAFLDWLRRGAPEPRTAS